MNVVHLAVVWFLGRAGGGEGGGFEDGGGGLGGGGGGGFFFFGGGTTGLIVFGVFILLRLYGQYQRNQRRNRGERPGVAAQPVRHSGELLGGGNGPVRDRAALTAGLAAIAAHDPGFNEADLLADANRAFFTVQEAWTDRKPEISRLVMHDGIWQQHKFQIGQYLAAGKQNVLEHLAVQNTVLVAADSDASFDTVVIRFFASCADYDVDVSSDRRKVTRGSTAVEPWAEDWIFQRSSAAVTKPHAGTLNKRCPNCGAPLDLDLAGVCAYCRAPVMSGEFDWVLTRIEQLPSYQYAQQTVP
jgi:hypothetical protein